MSLITEPVTLDAVLATIEGLERQLQLLKAQVRRMLGPGAIKTAADLQGIFAGLMDASEEDLEAVKYRLDLEAWDKLQNDNSP